MGFASGAYLSSQETVMTDVYARGTEGKAEQEKKERESRITEEDSGKEKDKKGSTAEPHSNKLTSKDNTDGSEKRKDEFLLSERRGSTEGLLEHWNDPGMIATEGMYATEGSMASERRLAAKSGSRQKKANKNTSPTMPNSSMSRLASSPSDSSIPANASKCSSTPNITSTSSSRAKHAAQSASVTANGSPTAQKPKPSPKSVRDASSPSLSSTTHAHAAPRDASANSSSGLRDQLALSTSALHHHPLLLSSAKPGSSEPPASSLSTSALHHPSSKGTSEAAAGSSSSASALHSPSSQAQCTIAPSGGGQDPPRTRSPLHHTRSPSRGTTDSAL